MLFGSQYDYVQEPNKLDQPILRRFKTRYLWMVFVYGFMGFVYLSSRNTHRTTHLYSIPTIPLYTVGYTPPLPVSPLIYPYLTISKRGVNDPNEISGQKFCKMGIIWEKWLKIFWKIYMYLDIIWEYRGELYVITYKGC